MVTTYTFDPRLTEAFDIYFFIQTINDATDSYSKDIKALTGIGLLTYKFFDYHSAHLEILFYKDLQRVYFVIHPSCRYLDKKSKDNLMETVNRDTANDKLTSFMAAYCPIF